MTTQEKNKQTALDLVETIFNQKKLDRIAGFYTENLQDHNLPAGLPSGIEGKRIQITAFLKAFPDLHIRYNFQVAENDLVAGHYTMTGTHLDTLGEIPVTGRKINISGFDCLRFENGKVAEQRTVTDGLDFMKQLGIIPEDYIIGKRD